jgi:hypothetical protein
MEPKGEEQRKRRSYSPPLGPRMDPPFDLEGTVTFFPGPLADALPFCSPSFFHTISLPPAFTSA